MKKCLFIIGNDKIGRRLVYYLELKNCLIPVYFDSSSNMMRIINLFWKQRIAIRHFFKMTLAELFRIDYKLRYQYPSIYSNNELLEVIYKNTPQKVYFFRAGLIIKKNIIETGIDLINIHCADTHKYGGLASIARAIENGDYSQHAVMHKLTEKIDDGKIIATELYKMEERNSYLKNEDIAYEAGIKLLLKEFDLELKGFKIKEV